MAKPNTPKTHAGKTLSCNAGKTLSCIKSKSTLAIFHEQNLSNNKGGEQINNKNIFELILVLNILNYCEYIKKEKILLKLIFPNLKSMASFWCLHC